MNQFSASSHASASFAGIAFSFASPMDRRSHGSPCCGGPAVASSVRFILSSAVNRSALVRAAISGR